MGIMKTEFALYSLSLISIIAGVEIITDKGVVDGTVKLIEYNGLKALSTFLGVPYAKPPTGERRFVKPEPMDEWTGIMPVESYKNPCIQLLTEPKLTSLNSSEDCLYLNIFSPIDLSKPMASLDKKAVMVWIHGGGFVVGSADGQDATYLSLHGDVVVVTMNYRLGPFGFLDTNGASPANLGLWDQNLALQWIQNNIEHFGGDNNKVTVFGESAGSMSIAYHMISPKTDDSLFHKAILQTGGFNIQLLFPDPKDSGVKLAEALGCRYLRGSEMRRCLKGKTTSEINTKAAELYISVGFVPLADGDFLPYDPTQLLKNYTLYGSKGINSTIANFAKYDIIAGFNGQEGLPLNQLLVMVTTEWKQGLSSEQFAAGVQDRIWSLVKTSYTGHLLSDMILAQYALPFEGSDLLSMNQKRLRWFTDQAGDGAFSWPTLEVALMHEAVAPTKKTYLYYLDYKRENTGVLWDRGPDWLRVSADHGDDVFLVFYNGTGYGSDYTEMERNLSAVMMSYWTNFAKFGNPKSEHQAARGGTVWPEISEDDRKYLHIKYTADLVETDPLGSKAQFWRSLVVGAALSNFTVLAIESCNDQNPDQNSAYTMTGCVTLATLIAFASKFAAEYFIKDV